MKLQIPNNKFQKAKKGIVRLFCNLNYCLLEFKVLLLAVPVVCFLSCNKPVDKQTLISYVNDPDNGLKKEIQSGDYKISLTYKPTDLLVEQEIGNDTALTTETIEAKRKQFDAYHYFVLTMSAGEKDMLYSGAGGTNYSEMVTKINFRLREYIYAIQDKKDTLVLADYYIPNLYGMGGKTQILLAFEKAKEEEQANKALAIKIKELGFGMGEQQFEFKEKDFVNIPSLKL
jgi:hypothetical protein